MTFLELAKTRQSTRSYAPTPVDRQKIDRCLEAARLAPSACNSQPWKFVVVDDPQLKQAVANETFSKIMTFNNFTTQAPVLVAIVRESSKPFARFGAVVKNKDFSMMDIAIAAEHFCLQATQEGLGTCMLGWFDEPAVKKLLRIPAKKRVPLVITLGYPDPDELREKQRKTIQQITCYNSYT